MGLDHYFNSNINMNSFNRFFGVSSRNKEFEVLRSKSSLLTYNTFKLSYGMQQYLVNVDDFESSRLKLLARTNCLPLNSVLHRMHIHVRSSPLCSYCNNGSHEDFNHILTGCPLYVIPRNNLLLSIQGLLSDIDIEFDFIGLPLSGKVQFLLGDAGYGLSPDVGDSVDTLCKTFLSNVFRIRTEMI